MEKNKTYSSAYNGDDSISLFLTFCIEQYAHLKGILGAKSMKILSDAGILEYLSKRFILKVYSGFLTILINLSTLKSLSNENCVISW